MSGELRGPADALLDEGLAGLSARGIGTVTGWRVRCKDDDLRVWRAAGDTVDALTWRGPGDVAALRSLRPVAFEVRAEGDGAASRTVIRRPVADAVVVRRWREKGLSATLLRPPGAPVATVAVSGAEAAGDATGDTALACALLASRGVLVVHVIDGLDRALELLGAVPGAAGPEVLDALPLPPGVPATAVADAVAWDALLRHLGAVARDT